MARAPNQRHVALFRATKPLLGVLLPADVAGDRLEAGNAIAVFDQLHVLSHPDLRTVLRQGREFEVGVGRAFDYLAAVELLGPHAVVEMDERQEVPADQLVRVVFHEAGADRVHVGEESVRIAHVHDVPGVFDQAPEPLAVHGGPCHAQNPNDCAR